MKLSRRILICTLFLTNVIFCIATAAQNESGRGGRWADQPHVSGTITAIRPDAFDIQTPDGKSATVKISSGTQFRKNRESAQLSDFKVGDRILAVGDQPKEGPFLAKMVAAFAPGTGAPANGFRGGAFSPEDMGKKFIMGQVTKIGEAKLTIMRPDNVEQVIQADENTSFRNDKGESVTLADIKVGDRIGGQGELKDGVFVPQVLRIGGPNRQFRQNGEKQAAPAPDQKPAPEKN